MELREATHAEGKAMAHELALMREEEERDGTVLSVEAPARERQAGLPGGSPSKTEAHPEDPSVASGSR